MPDFFARYNVAVGLGLIAIAAIAVSLVWLFSQNETIYEQTRTCGVVGVPDSDGEASVTGNELRLVQASEESTDREPDFVINLTGPKGFDVASRCKVEIRKVLVGDSSELVYASGAEAQVDLPGTVPVFVPVGGLQLRIFGLGLVPITAEVRRNSTDECRLMSKQDLIDAGLVARDAQPYGATNFSGQGSHPTLAFTLEQPLRKGDVLGIEVVPLVRIDAVLTDENGSVFCPPKARWSASWRLPNFKGAHGRYKPDDQVGVTNGDGVSWYVPFGAEFSARVELLDVAINPPAHRRSVVAPVERDKLRFTAIGFRLGRIRVLSEDRIPLENAQVARCQVVEDTVAEKRVTGEIVLLLPPDHRRIDVWAPDHLMTELSTADIPTDGSYLEVVLGLGQPGLRVKVEPESGNLDPKYPIWIDARTHFVLPDRQPNWRWVLELPSTGEVTIYGNPQRVPAAKPRSAGYEFELVEKSTADGLPFHRYIARKLTGIRVKIVSGGEFSWPGGALVIVSRALEVRAESEVGSLAVRDGQFTHLTVDAEKFMALGRGSWVVRAIATGEEQVFGEAYVSVVDKIVDVELAPRTTYEWREYTIHDLTGSCRGKGTAFLAGFATLAGLTEAQEAAQQYAEKIVSGEGTDGRFTLAPTACVAAHADGVVRIPTWFGGRILVMPSHGRGFYEGEIEATGSIITVRQLKHGATVEFGYGDGVSVEKVRELQQPGWFVAIREYSSMSDLSRVDGTDFKISTLDGRAELQSLPPGTYVAYYVRAGTQLLENAKTGRLKQTIRLDWFDSVKFDVGTETAQVVLPVTRR